MTFLKTRVFIGTLIMAMLLLLGIFFLFATFADYRDDDIVANVTALPTQIIPASTPSTPDTVIASLTPQPTVVITTKQPLTITATIPPSTETPVPTPTEMAHGLTNTIGFSVEQRPITSYQFKNGDNKIIFVGGMHGGYEWNTIILAYEMIDHFMEFPDQIPESSTLIIIPSANPDGQFTITNKNGRFTYDDIDDHRWEAIFPGRFNANGVDLNRNWDCMWTESAIWRDQPINPGAIAFSEPETIALKNFFLEQQPAAVIFWHSTANAVFAAQCPHIYAPSLVLANVYGSSAGYPVYETFTSYQITGDASDWLATQEIPAITVELATYDTEYEQNIDGVLAVMASYGNRVLYNNDAEDNEDATAP